MTSFDKFIEIAKINGTDRYISPDKKIDASTCLYPDKTWFIKNLNHKDFPDVVNLLMAEMINNPDFSITSDESYPQFMVYDAEKDNILPLVAENENTAGNNKWQTTFWEALRKLIMTIIRLIMDSQITV